MAMVEKLKAMDDLVLETKDTIKEFVKSRGGFIRMNEEYGYARAFVFNCFFNEVTEQDITAVAVFGDTLYISHNEDITSDENGDWRVLDCEGYVELQTTYQLAKELYFNNY